MRIRDFFKKEFIRFKPKQQIKLDELTDEEVLEMLRDMPIDWRITTEEKDFLIDFLNNKMHPIGDTEIETAKRLSTFTTDLRIRGNPEAVIERFSRDRFKRLLIISSLPDRDFALAAKNFINGIGPLSLFYMLKHLFEISGLIDKEEMMEEESE